MCVVASVSIAAWGIGAAIDKMVRERAAEEYYEDGVPMICFRETCVGSRESNLDLAEIHKVIGHMSFQSLQNPNPSSQTQFCTEL